MKSLSCREAGCDCDYIATGQTEEELMEKLREHGMKEHGKTEEDMMQMKDKLKDSIRATWGIHKGIFHVLQNVPLEYLDTVQNIFITDMFQHFECLRKLKGREVTIVIHDRGEIFKFNEPYLKYWNIITIRKSIRQYLRDRYGIESKFIYHPFFPYPIRPDYDDEKKTQAISISRVDFNKNIEVILDANRRARNNPVKIYGWANKEYASQKLDPIEFSKYYQGKYAKSFDATSEILKKAKFMIDLSFLSNDGGGTQYTFLDAIYHNCAIILNRQWIENVDPKYRDFKEGENCYAVSNAEELKELLDNAENVDISKIVHNARKLLDRHIKAVDWNKEIISLVCEL